MSYQSLQGATVVGLICSDGVVLAAEKRVSFGRMVMSRSGKKVFKITPSIGLAFAGLVSDMQALTREATAYANLYKLDNNRPIKVNSVAKLISNLLFNRRLMPLLMETLVAGVDDDGPALFSMDPVGSLIPDDYMTAGSGAALAMGHIEAKYSKEMDVEAGVELALESIRAAVKRFFERRAAYEMLVITSDGTEERAYTI